MWKRETLDAEPYVENLISLALENDEDDHHIKEKCLEKNHGCLAGA